MKSDNVGYHSMEGKVSNPMLETPPTPSKYRVQQHNKTNMDFQEQFLKLQKETVVRKVDNKINFMKKFIDHSTQKYFQTQNKKVHPT
jgi:hypothetical protein